MDSYSGISEENSCESIDEPQWYYNVAPELDAAQTHPPGDDNTRNSDDKPTLRDNVSTGVSGCGMKCEEEMLHGVSYHHLLKEEVNNGDARTEQPKLVCKQEKAEVVMEENDDECASINDLGQRRRDQLLDRAYVKQEATLSFAMVNVVKRGNYGVGCDREMGDDGKHGCNNMFLLKDTHDSDVAIKHENDFTVNLKEVVKPELTQSLCSQTVSTPSLSYPPDTLATSHTFNAIRVLPQDRDDTSVVQDLVDGYERETMTAPLLVQPCLDDNEPHNSRQHVGKIAGAVHCVKKKVEELQCVESVCFSRPKCNVDQGSDIKTHNCHVCDYHAPSASKLVIHQRKHSGEKPYQCDKCPFVTAQAGILVNHKRKHTGEKPYQCDKCPYAAARACTLVKHKRRHTGEKPYQCDKCPYATGQAGALVRHKRKHTGEKPYQCDKCPYATAHACTLVTHKRIHTGEKPYRCDKCPYAAAGAGTLGKHKRTHTGERPYQCDKCPYAAAEAGTLVTHKRKHTGGKPYLCDKCPYAAARACALTKHKGLHTTEIDM